MRLLAAIVALLTTLSLTGPGFANDGELVEKAFGAWVERARIATADSILVAQVPCDESVCVQLTIDPIVRQHAMPRLAELMAGFGFDADVVSASLTTNSTTGEAALVVVTHQSKGTVPARTRLATAANHVALLKALADLNAKGGQPASLAAVANDAPFYYLADVTILGSRSTARLLAPPLAPVPKFAGPISGGQGCQCKPHLASRQSVPAGPQIGWQTYQLRCNWVCTDKGKPIE